MDALHAFGPGPTDGQPTLDVSITDGTGTINAVWTGRRSIGGISLGRTW